MLRCTPHRIDGNIHRSNAVFPSEVGLLPEDDQGSGHLRRSESCADVRQSIPSVLRVECIAGRPQMKTIVRLNDEFRSTFEAGRALMSAAVNALPVEVRAAAMQAFSPRYFFADVFFANSARILLRIT